MHYDGASSNDSLVDRIPDSIRRSAAGGFAATFGKTFTAPLERVRIIRQAAHRGKAQTRQLLTSIYTEEGVRGLWKGNAVNLLRVAPSYAVRLTVFGNLSAYEDRIPLLGNSFVAGSLSGLASAFASYPLEVLRTRISVSGSLREALVRGRLFAGCSLTVLETTPYAGLTLGTYAYLGKHYPGETIYDKILHGMVAGAMGTAVCFPIDTVRRNKIVCPSETAISIVLRLRAEGGYRRFYRGITVALAKAAPTVAITMITNDFILGALHLRPIH